MLEGSKPLGKALEHVGVLDKVRHYSVDEGLEDPMSV